MSQKEFTYSSSVVRRFKFRQMIVMWLHTELYKVNSAIFLILGIAMRALGAKRKGMRYILKARRISMAEWVDSMLAKKLRDNPGGLLELEKHLNPTGSWVASDCAVRILILKLPRLVDDEVVEKGAIIVKFTETFDPLYQLVNTESLLKYFRLVLEPSWVGYSLPEILVWTTRHPEKIIVLSPYESDFQLLSNLKSNLVPILLGPADWADGASFHSIPSVEKIYDAIYVANFNPIKRVDRYIRAVVDINKVNPSYKVALICAPHGTAKLEVLSTLHWATQEQGANIDFFGAVPQKELNILFNQSKINVLFSLREGANKGLAEGLFAGLPALLMAECACGNFRHINQKTGRVVSDKNLEAAMMDMSERCEDFAPAEWAKAHISSAVSTRYLSDHLREIEVSEGREWTQGLFEKVNQPELGYLNQEDHWLLAQRQELLSAFSRGGSEHEARSQIVKLLELASTKG